MTTDNKLLLSWNKNDITGQYIRSTPDKVLINGTAEYWEFKAENRPNIVIEALPFAISCLKYKIFGVKTIYAIKNKFTEKAFLATPDIRKKLKLDTIFFPQNANDNKIDIHSIYKKVFGTRMKHKDVQVSCQSSDPYLLIKSENIHRLIHNPYNYIE